MQSGHTEATSKKMDVKRLPTWRSSIARSWIRDYFATQADYAPIGETTLHIPPRPHSETYNKYCENCGYNKRDTFGTPLGSGQFRRVFNEMMSKPFVCPFTHRTMTVKKRTQRARGFKLCSKCEDYRMLLWTCKNNDKKQIYKRRLRAHWLEHEDGRDVYHDNQNYCKRSGGAAVSIAVDAADQAKFGVFTTSHRGMQDSYLKVKQKITGALVHGLGYFLFR